MTFSNLLHQTVTIYNKTEDPDDVDRYGNPATTEVGTSSAAWVQPLESRLGGSRELDVDRETRLSHFIIFLPVTTSITGTSEVAYNDQRYRVLGEPRVIDDATGPHHLEADLEQLSG